jgi:uncharacterized membrane protein
MKTSDIDRIHAAGLISTEQRGAIVEHFQLDRETNKLMVILSIIGAVLVSAGVILSIAANWEEIPRFAKLAGGLGLMLGCHFGGSRLRKDDRHPVVGQALHLVGSGLFLANIALVGQIYNLSSRPPNAILLWWLGIAPLAWILRSRAQHILTLCALGLWLGLELNQRDSLLFFDGGARQFMFYALFGVCFAGFGMWLSRTKFPEFGPTTEKFGLLVMHIVSYPLTLGFFYGSDKVATGAWVASGVTTALAVGFIALSLKNERLLGDRQWRWTWALALAGILALGWVGLLVRMESGYGYYERHLGPHWIAVPALFFFCLLQVQVGLLRRSPWLVNVAMTFLALHVVTAYFQLFGTMGTTGLMFIVTGLFLVGLAFFLERKRRAVLKRMASTSAA